MDKNDVLKKAQEEKYDEREIFINDKSSVWISRTLISMAGFIVAIRESHNLPFFDIVAILCFSICAGELYKYYVKRENKNLYFFILLFIIGIVATVLFLRIF